MATIPKTTSVKLGPVAFPFTLRYVSCRSFSCFDIGCEEYLKSFSKCELRQKIPFQLVCVTGTDILPLFFHIPLHHGANLNLNAPSRRLSVPPSASETSGAFQPSRTRTVVERSLSHIFWRFSSLAYLFWSSRLALVS